MFTAHINKNNEMQSCKEHCAQTAFLCRRCMSDTGFENISYLAGILHDCGKFTNEFNDYIMSASKGEKVRKGEVIHSFAGVSLVLNEYHRKHSDNEYELLTAEIIAAAVGSHHGLFDCVDDEGKSGFKHRLEKQPEYDARAIENFYKECCCKAQLNKLFQKAEQEIENAVEKIKKIAEDKKDETEVHYYLTLLIRLLTSAVVDSDRLDTAQFMNGFNIDEITADWNKAIKNLDAYLNSISSNSPINAARQEISDLCFEAGKWPPGIYKLNVPTGGGKTLSALRFALNHAKQHNKKRIILISPLLSILDQNAKTVREAINDDNIIFEHHSNVLKETAPENGNEQDKYDYLTDTWNSPIIITTLVQFLNTLFLGKMSAVRRFHSLCNAVIVIDEIQTVPNNMLSIFNLAINFLCTLCASTVVMCSATQPGLGKVSHSLRGELKDIVPPCVVEKYNSVFKRTQIVDKGFLGEKEIADFVKSLAEKSKSTLVVCNTKKEAGKLFSELSFLNAKCFHLSAGMCQQHRKDTLSALKYALGCNEKVICVSTQVIEAGVDISFNTVVRYAAGLDNIIQSAGRCNRNGEEGSLAKVYVVNFKNEKLTHLESISQAKKATESLLNSYSENMAKYDNDIAGKKAISQYYSKLYSEFALGYMDCRLSSELPSMYKLLSYNDEWGNKNLASDYLILNSMKSAGKNFKVFDDNQTSVIVPYGNAKDLLKDLELKYYKGFELGDCFSEIQKLKPFSVSIPFYQYEKYCSTNAITEIFDGKLLLLDRAYYDNQVGILSEKKEEEDICNSLIL